MSNQQTIHCTRCGTPLDPKHLSGLCPRCLAAQHFATDTAAPDASVKHEEPPPSPEAIAESLPQLEAIEFLGRGGMGVIYKARQKSLGRTVALKILAPERLGDADFAARFEREAKALAVLNHPNIVTIYDFGKAGDFYYLLMEFIDGVNLRQALSAGRFTPEQSLAIVPPVCEALQYAHEHGVVHRDIKPENLLLDKAGRVKIADFGIAKILGTDTLNSDVSESQPAGTPQYMAPEQMEHRVTDHRADIYSLGVVLYEMLTGELPAEKLRLPSGRVQVDVRIDELVLRALEKTPELRYQSAAEFRTQVETFVAGNGKSDARVLSSERDPFHAIHAIPLRFRLILGAMLLACLLNFGVPDALHRGDGTARTITIGLSEPWIVVHPKVANSPEAGRRLDWNFQSASFLSGFVALTIIATLLISRGNECLPTRWRDRKLASLALIYALISAGLIVMSAIWHDGSWPMMALAFIFAVVAMVMAISVRRTGAGLSALVVAALCMFTWPVAAFIIQRSNRATHSTASGPEIQSVSVSSEQAVVKARGSDDAGMFFRFGNVPNQWVPSSLYLEGMFDVLLTFGAFERGVRWNIKPRHGIHGRYRLDGPHGSMQGKIVFRAGNPAPKTDGFYVIADFRPDQGLSQPIAVKVERGSDAPSDINNHPSVLTNNTQQLDPVRFSVDGQQTLTFSLQHKLARNMASALQQVLHNCPGCAAKPAEDDKNIIVTAPPEVMSRVRTFITVNDATDTLAREEPHGYPQSTPQVAVRAFLHACAIEDTDEAIASMLSVGVLAELRGDKSTEFESYQTSGIADPKWEADLRGDWPDKNSALRMLVREWNRHSLQAINEPDQDMTTPKQFVATRFFDARVNLSFVHIVASPSALEMDQQGDKRLPETKFFIDSFPVWWPNPTSRRALTAEEKIEKF